MKSKRKKYLLFLVVVFLTACGSENENNMPISEGYLPKRIENISEGGVIPKGSEAKKEICNGLYPLESFWGNWVPEEEYISDETFDVYTVTATNSDTGEVEEAKSLEIERFPSRLTFSAPWKEVSAYGGLDFEAPIVDYSLDMNEEAEEFENTLLGQTVTNYGLGQGSVEYNYIEPEDSWEALSLIGSGGKYKFIYGISEDNLAIGLISSQNDNAEEFDITEIDYKISFSGWKMTLTYGEESVTYVPEFTTIDEKDLWPQVADLYNDGLEPGYNPIDGILGIDIRFDSNQVMYDSHEGYVDAVMDFREDGTVSISAANGKSSELKYLTSEKTLTLISEEGMGVYSEYRPDSGSMNVTAGAKAGIQGLDTLGTSIIVDGEDIGLAADTDFQELLDAGFSTAIDTSQLMQSCVVSEEIVLSKAGADIKVKVVNPWEKAVPLGNCKVCNVYVNDQTGTINSGDDSIIGVTKYENMEDFFEAAYEKKPDLLRYKSFGATSVDFMESLSESKKNKKYGEQLLDTSTSEMEILYHYQNGILCAFEIRCPELLFNGLQDNVDNDVLTNVNAKTMRGIIKKRDNILKKLQNAFSKANVNVNIDESSGEIALDTKVLFDYDSYELTAKGKDYIDNFMEVYAEVILDDSLKNIISEVRFEGHTDSNGSYNYNLELSQKRADAVLKYCLSSDSACTTEKQRERLNKIASAIGYSFADLVYDEQGEEDEDASRRVEIKFYIKTGKENSEAKETTVSSVNKSILSKDDFNYTWNGKNVNALEELSSGNIICFYATSDDNENDSFETYRGI